MKFAALLLFLGFAAAGNLGDLDQVVLGEICASAGEKGKCDRKGTFNYNPDTRKCHEVKEHEECGFFLYKKKCKHYCRSVDPFNIKKRDKLKSDFD